MLVMKFGGSSVATPDRVSHVVKLVLEAYKKHDARAVVFSAFGGVTDDLLAAAERAGKGDASYREVLQRIDDRHREAVLSLVPTEIQFNILHDVGELIRELRDILHGIYLLRENGARSRDFVLSFGERLSARIITSVLRRRMEQVVFLDTRDVIKTTSDFGNAAVLEERSYLGIQKFFEANKGLVIVTGFIGSTLTCETTTLGRGGSDLTASLIGAAIGAKSIQIWTDVSGVLTADPRKVHDVRSIPRLTYSEAMEMSHFGAKVIYPPTMAPAMRAGIPLEIKNTFKPEDPGTLVSRTAVPSDGMVTGLSSIDHVSLLQVKGSGLIGVAGVSQRLFGALARRGISIILISQASSEHSICFAVSPKDGDQAERILSREFELEIERGQIEPVICDHDCSVIAAVGEGMRHIPGIAAKFFSAMARGRINVMAIAQGSSEFNISVIVKREDETPALRALHQVLFEEDDTVASLFLVGTGLIGKQLLKIIAGMEGKPNAPKIRVVGLANSRKMLIRRLGIPSELWQDQWVDEAEDINLQAFRDRMFQGDLPHPVWVDCTAGEQTAAEYVRVLAHRIPVVAANKRALSGSQEHFEQILETSRRLAVPFLFETNVGAALPVIAAIRNLVASGDQVRRIEAVLSGTLSYLFNTYDGSRSFSDVVAEAQKNGFTEPDPREDLNGMDVARKLTILARLAGHQINLDDVEVENLVPQSCEPGLQGLLKGLEDHEQQFQDRYQAAQAEQCKLRYLAVFEQGKVRIGLRAVGPEHPAYGLSGSDNLIAVHSDQYRNSPLVVRGPGAGAEVTASGVLTDILRAAHYIV